MAGIAGRPLRDKNMVARLDHDARVRAPMAGGTGPCPDTGMRVGSRRQPGRFGMAGIARSGCRQMG